MVKDESSEFFQEDKKLITTDTANPDIMGKWVGVAEKTIGLFENIMAMKQKQAPKTGGESSAYEKGMSQGLQNATAQAQVVPTPTPLPAPTPTPATLKIDSEGAVKYLFEALEKTNQETTLKDYLEGDLKEARESGILKTMVETFIKNFTELQQ